MKIPQTSVSEPDKTEDWENWSPADKNDAIRRMALCMFIEGLIILWLLSH